MTAPPPTVSSLTRDEQIEEVFLDQVRGAQPNLESREGDGMVIIAEAFCTGYDNGATSNEINDFILEAAGDAYTVMELVTIHGAAVGAFCPEHIDKLG
ncbi:DUF732 domain-containing protein [Arthrobacter echini]|uniref:DUF732 domain-containing protein n=1 Tax=Arthrobacter echini TaxID=1529066 RepID=UPI0014560710|nr:DUF732 domain-containing protein [Arthrobacter echini]